MKKKITILLSVLAIAVIGYLFYPCIALFTCIGYDSLKEHLNRLPFDSERWKKGNKDEIRIRMIDSLFRQYDFNEKTKVEVIDILGQPDKTTYFSEYNMVYRLGTERGFIRIDSEWLVFRLDTNNIVQGYRIVRD